MNAFRAFFEVSTNEYKKKKQQQQKRRVEIPVGCTIKTASENPKLSSVRNVVILGFGNGATALFLSAPGPTF